MASAGQKVGTVFFAVFLVGAILVDWLCCVILEGFKSIGFLSNSTKVGADSAQLHNHSSVSPDACRSSAVRIPLRLHLNTGRLCSRIL
jgi:hypothetical protein